MIARDGCPRRESSSHGKLLKERSICDSRFVAVSTKWCVAQTWTSELMAAKKPSCLSMIDL